MAKPTTPVYMPGGLAPVRDVDGDERFITDMIECCCAGCPTAEHCDDVCAATYYFEYDGSGSGSGEGGVCNCDVNCAEPYLFHYYWEVERQVFPACSWYQRIDGIGGTGFFPTCTATLRCSDGIWILTVANNDGIYNSYSKGAMPGSCPAGLYTWFQGTCSTHSDTVTVYDAPIDCP